MSMPYSVPCPLGAVTSVAAEKRSARPSALPAACSARIDAAKRWSVNMSSSVVTPKTSAPRSTSPNACTWASRKPGRSVLPVPSITVAPSGGSIDRFTAWILPSWTSTSAAGRTRSPSNTRAPRIRTSGEVSARAAVDKDIASTSLAGLRIRDSTTLERSGFTEYTRRHASLHALRGPGRHARTLRPSRGRSAHRSGPRGSRGPRGELYRARLVPGPPRARVVAALERLPLRDAARAPLSLLPRSRHARRRLPLAPLLRGGPRRGVEALADVRAGRPAHEPPRVPAPRARPGRRGRRRANGGAGPRAPDRAGALRPRPAAPPPEPARVVRGADPRGARRDGAALRRAAVDRDARARGRREPVPPEPCLPRARRGA